MRTTALATTALLAGAALAGWLIRSTAAADPAADKPLVHVVLFDLKDDAPAAAAADLVRDAHQMLAEIPVVESVEAGRRAPAPREVHVKDYDVGLYLRLRGAADVSTYLEHPLHVGFAQKHGPNIKRVRVCDFYSE